MDIEIMLHGVPSGQDYYGIKEEQRLSEFFYDDSNEETKFYVEIKEKDNIAYSYYTYLKYGSIIGEGGRPGSYFGLTIRIDEYYKDVNHIYNILEIVFKKHILGTIINPVGNSYKYKYKYITPDFKSKKVEIEKIEKSLIQLIISTCVASKFVKIDNSLVNQFSSLPSFNINEMDEEKVMLYLKKYSRFVSSPSYKTESEKQIDSKIKEMNSREGEKIAERDRKILEKDSTIRNLEGTISKRDSEIASLKESIKKLEQNSEVAQLVTKIKEPITSLAKYFSVKDTQIENKAPESKSDRKNFYLTALNTILGVLIIVLLFTVGGGSSTKVEEAKEYIALQTSFNALQDSYKNLDISYKDLEGKYKGLENENNKLTQEKIDLLAKIDKREADKLRKAEDAKKKAEAEAKRKAEEEAKKKAEAEARRKAEEEAKKKAEAANQESTTSEPGTTAQITINEAEPTVQTNSGPKSDDTGIQIKIVPDVQEVVVGEEYEFSIADYSGKGEWKVDGFSKPANKTSSTIKVKAKAEGSNNSATISYTPNNGDKVKRTFKYKE